MKRNCKKNWTIKFYFHSHTHTHTVQTHIHTLASYFLLLSVASIFFLFLFIFFSYFFKDLMFCTHIHKRLVKFIEKNTNFKLSCFKLLHSSCSLLIFWCMWKWEGCIMLLLFDVVVIDRENFQCNKKGLLDQIQCIHFFDGSTPEMHPCLKRWTVQLLFLGILYCVSIFPSAA